MLNGVDEVVAVDRQRANFGTYPDVLGKEGSAWRWNQCLQFFPPADYKTMYSGEEMKTPPASCGRLAKAASISLSLLARSMSHVREACGAGLQVVERRCAYRRGPVYQGDESASPSAPTRASWLIRCRRHFSLFDVTPVACRQGGSSSQTSQRATGSGPTGDDGTGGFPSLDPTAAAAAGVAITTPCRRSTQNRLRLFELICLTYRPSVLDIEFPPSTKPSSLQPSRNAAEAWRFPHASRRARIR